MLPLRDEYPSRTTPFVTYALIGVNILVYLWQMSVPDEQAFSLALFPIEYFNGINGNDLLHLLTSMFMHGGLAHIGGNMLYLWIFGDNIEDSMGHSRFLAFYLLGGFLASIVHIISDPFSMIPTVGASGAIAAVLGAYLVLYPSRRVLTLIWFGIFVRMTYVPAMIVLGLWFILQLFQGLITLGATGMGGVAFWAHIGGFVTGLVLVKVFRKPPSPSNFQIWTGNGWY
jgi:membrane associated rhomboid family serine protease